MPDRIQIKEEAKQVVRGARVNAYLVTLIVLARYGWVAAAWVSGLRVIAGGLLLGQFLSPGFFMSLTGALLSLLVLGLAVRLPRRWFGPVSWSILAAFAHIGGQFATPRDIADAAVKYFVYGRAEGWDGVLTRCQQSLPARFHLFPEYASEQEISGG